MSKKDYVRAASIVRALREKALAPDVAQAAEVAFVALFSEPDRPFDADRFRKACES
jgi:hypothetical protein